nr:MFS transporter [Acrocarpospora pleiomorpha]
MVRHNRALAVGVVTAILSLGAAVAPLLAGALIDNVGWRGAYGVMALVSACSPPSSACSSCTRPSPPPS